MKHIRANQSLHCSGTKFSSQQDDPLEKAEAAKETGSSTVKGMVGEKELDEKTPEPKTTAHLRRASNATTEMSSTGELSGIYLGILNIYTTIPQFVGTGKRTPASAGSANSRLFFSHTPTFVSLRARCKSAFAEVRLSIFRNRVAPPLPALRMPLSGRTPKLHFSLSTIHNVSDHEWHKGINLQIDF